MWKVEVRVVFKTGEKTYYEYFADHKTASAFYEGLKGNPKIHRRIMKVRMRTRVDLESLLALYLTSGGA